MRDYLHDAHDAMILSRGLGRTLVGKEVILNGELTCAPEVDIDST